VAAPNIVPPTLLLATLLLLPHAVSSRLVITVVDNAATALPTPSRCTGLAFFAAPGTR
jgi:hypothetical protein